jgi:cell division protein FtsL
MVTGLREREENLVKDGLSDVQEKVKNARAALSARVGKMRLAWRIILVVALISLAAIIWLSQTSTIVSIGYSMEKLDKEATVLDRQAEELNSQIAALEHPRRIEKEAREKLGMKEATKFVYVNVSATAEDNSPTSSNPKLLAVSDWWRELVKILPKPWYGTAPKER